MTNPRALSKTAGSRVESWLFQGSGAKTKLTHYPFQHQRSRPGKGERGPWLAGCCAVSRVRSANHGARRANKSQIIYVGEVPTGLHESPGFAVQHTSYFRRGLGIHSCGSMGQAPSLVTKWRNTAIIKPGQSAHFPFGDSHLYNDHWLSDSNSPGINCGF